MENFNNNDYNHKMGHMNYPYINNQNYNYPNVHNEWMNNNNFENFNDKKDFFYDIMGYINYPYMNNIYFPYRNNPKISNEISSYENLNEALMLIKSSVESEKEDEVFYANLLTQTTNSRDREIIQSIIADEKRHNKMFRVIYEELTGITLPPDELNSLNTSKESYINNLEKALFGELSAVEKYRKILAAMPDKEKYNMLMEIMTDELKHASKYNFLITKNIR